MCGNGARTGGPLISMRPLFPEIRMDPRWAMKKSSAADPIFAATPIATVTGIPRGPKTPRIPPLVTLVFDAAWMPRVSGPPQKNCPTRIL